MRELPKAMKGATWENFKSKKRTMHYFVRTPDRGFTLRPNYKWDGSKEYEFTISGREYLNCAKDPETRRSVSVYSKFLNGSTITMNIGM